MTDKEIKDYLHGLYKERQLCKWCQHPKHLPANRGLCSSCYRLALDFRKNATPGLANAIEFARNEGVINPVDWPIDGLEVERLFEHVSDLVFPWKKRIENPLWQTANTWGESFSNAQLSLLFHYFSMVTRAVTRKMRRARAEWHLTEMKDVDIKKATKKAEKAVAEVFTKT